MVVEILSPQSRGVDLITKMAPYARPGVPEYWVADPFRRVFAVNALHDGDYEPVSKL